MAEPILLQDVVQSIQISSPGFVVAGDQFHRRPRIASTRPASRHFEVSSTGSLTSCDSSNAITAADVARTRLIVSAGARPSGPSSLIGRLDPLGRRLLIRLYMRAYRRSAPLDQARVDRWTPLVAVVRLTAGIPEERGRLIEMFESSIQLNGR